MGLLFDVGSCIRATSKFSECTKCVDICPVSTIEIVENVPAFTPSACIECGGCVGVCPTESFSLSDFSAINFFFGALEKREHKFACKKELPCLSILSVEHLISLALGSDEPIILDAEACKCGGESRR
jgi:ferredoxin